MSSFADELLTVAEVVEQLKLNPQTFRNWIDADKLPAVRIGRRSESNGSTSRRCSPVL